MTAPKTLADAIRHFSSFENCRDYMVARRWPNGVTCPKCGSSKVYFDNSRKGWECKDRHPQRKFTLKTGTVFEDSPLGLDKWLPVVWMIANMKNGVSSHEVARSIGVTQKTAWFMLQRVRLAMQDEDGGKLSGIVEVDETYIGGKARNMHKKKRERVLAGNKGGHSDKAAVMGLLERESDFGHSKVKLAVVKGAKRKDLLPTVEANVERLSHVYSDALRSYHTLSDNYTHKTVDHAEKYVDGQVHTNGLENFWSLLKRGLNGTYVNVEPFHLFRYLDEQAFRFNNRKVSDATRFDAVINSIIGKRLTYDALTGKLGLGPRLN
jgi:transposase-like protein